MLEINIKDNKRNIGKFKIKNSSDLDDLFEELKIKYR